MKRQSNLEIVTCDPNSMNHSDFRFQGKRELVALLNLSSWCLMMVERLFLAVSRGCLQFVIVAFPDHTHLLFLKLYQDYIFVFHYVAH